MVGSFLRCFCRNARHEVLHPASCKESPEDIARMVVLMTADDSLVHQEVRYKKHRTLPLHHALSCGHVRCARTLVRLGARIDVDDSSNVTAFMQLQKCLPYHEQDFADLLDHFFLLGGGLRHTDREGKVMPSHAIVFAILHNDHVLLSKCLANGDALEGLVTLSLANHNAKAYLLLLVHGADNETWLRTRSSCIPSLVAKQLLAKQISIDLAMLFLRIYHLFGGTFYDVSKVSCLTKKPLQGSVLRTLRTHAALKQFPQFTSLVANLVHTPASLVDLTRVRIARLVKPTGKLDLRHLDLPVNLRDSLLFPDLDPELTIVTTPETCSS